MKTENAIIIMLVLVVIVATGIFTFGNIPDIHFGNDNSGESSDSFNAIDSSSSSQDNGFNENPQENNPQTESKQPSQDTQSVSSQQT